MILKALSLSKRFGNLWALRDLNLELESRRIAILGPNGSGKSTLLLILSGLRYPSSGKLLVNGHEPYRERDWALNNISFIFEKPRYSYSIKVKDIVKLLSDYRGCRDEGVYLAEKLGLNEFYESKLADLSFGQAQLVGIWSCLACWEGIVVMDEPFAHLDAKRVAILLEILAKRGEIVYTTHVPEEAEVLADHVVLISEGRIIWSGSKNDLFKNDVFELVPISPDVNIADYLEKVNCDLITKVGLYVLVKNCNEESLSRLVNLGIITGFKRAGLRNLYASLSSKQVQETI